MKFYVGVTDYSWFSFLQERQPDEVNFWKPGGGGAFKAIEPGALFLFKLHKPHHFIVGGGYFVDFVRMPLSYAWDAFGEKNGRSDFNSFSKAISSYRKTAIEETRDTDIGCIILTSPFFLDRSDWIPAPEDWANSIVQGKSFESTEGSGRVLWEQIAPFLQSNSSVGVARDANVSLPARSIRELQTEYAERPVLGARYLRTARLGQGAFRALILDQYRKCCITGENTLPVLQAAHIKPVAASGTHSLRNGLLLRADLHILFDQGLVGITPEYRVRISPRIREKFMNGKIYNDRDGQELRSYPQDPELYPDPDLLDWHMKNCFRL